jgi:hypothetical protein
MARSLEKIPVILPKSFMALHVSGSPPRGR